MTYPPTFAYSEGAWLYLGYGDDEIAMHALKQPFHTISESLFYDKEFLCIAINGATGDCTIQRDALCTLPIFAGHQADRFVLSNKYERTFELLRKEDLHTYDFGLAVLTMGAPSVEVSLIEEIDILIDRSRATWNDGAYKKHLAPHGSITEVVQHRNGDPHAFRKHLEDTFEAYWQRYADNTQVGIELSGGFDSSSVYGYYASRGRTLYPASLVYSDSHGKDILLEKLEDLEQQFGIASHQVPMDVAHDYPLASMLTNNTQPGYQGEFLYGSSTEKMAAYMQELGVEVVFQGHGGDELFDNVPDYEKQNYTPRFLKALVFPEYVTPAFRSFASAAIGTFAPLPIPLLAYSSVLANIGCTNTYIDHDIWPVRPLADPRLFLYCQSLDIRYRMDRNIMAAYLDARQFPASVRRDSDETFIPFFVDAVATGLTPLFTELMRDSVMAKKGFVNADAALALWNAICEDPSKATRSEELFRLYCLLLVEINLRSLV